MSGEAAPAPAAAEQGPIAPLRKFWRGEYSLATAFWGFYFLGNVLLNAALLVLEKADLGIGIFFAAFLVRVVYFGFSSVGLWRSASPDTGWGVAARIFVGLWVAINVGEFVWFIISEFDVPAVRAVVVFGLLAPDLFLPAEAAFIPAWFMPVPALVILTAIPAWTLFARLGMSRWWTLLSLVLSGVPVLWVAAYWRSSSPELGTAPRS
jgi:hypothetical protein